MMKVFGKLTIISFVWKRKKRKKGKKPFQGKIRSYKSLVEFPMDSWFSSIDATANVSFCLLSFANLFVSRSFLFCSSFFSVSQYVRNSLVNCFLSLSLFLILSMFLFRYVLQYFALLALYDGFFFVRLQSLNVFGQLWKLNINIRLMQILHCNWKSKFWNVASICIHAHVAIKKKIFGPRFLLVRKSLGQNLRIR